MAIESLADRIQSLRDARGLSERELAQRVGITVHQYECVMRADANPTCALLVDLADALDVSIANVMEITSASTPSLGQMRAFREELRWRRATMTGGAHQLSAIDRRLARLDEALGTDAEPSGEGLNASIALMRAIERNEPVRVIASRYARLVLQRCAGKKGVAGRVLGIQHSTLGKYLRYRLDDDNRTMQAAEGGNGSRKRARQVEGDPAASLAS